MSIEVSTAELGEKLRRLVEDACARGEIIALERDGHRVAVITPSEEYDRWLERAYDSYGKQYTKIANVGDLCNECGNCDTFCPEYGGPFIEKPNFFRTREAWERFARRDGFYIESSHGLPCISGRIAGREYHLAELDQSRISFEHSEPLGSRWTRRLTRCVLSDRSRKSGFKVMLRRGTCAAPARDNCFHILLLSGMRRCRIRASSRTWVRRASRSRFSFWPVLSGRFGAGNSTIPALRPCGSWRTTRQRNPSPKI